jgi:tetratricopeptide (TPR) repeat protein
VTSAWWSAAEYYNPYYAEPVAAAATPMYYDYSQPVVVQNYYQQQDYGQQHVAGETPTEAAPVAQAPSPTSPKTERGLKKFDGGLAAFKRGNYQGAVERFNEALRLTPDDPVIHEVRALALFALGDYKSTAATLNALLATSPGMDWTTLSGLYGNVDDYSQQLRRLEARCQEAPRDAAAQFTLAYHYLVLGYSDEAVQALKAVVAAQPKDATAKHMLEALAPADEKAVAGAPPVPPAPSGVQQASATEAVLPPQSTTSAAASPKTDLVGKWRATADGATIELGIDNASQFEWSATPKGGKATKLSGKLLTTSDTLVLDSTTRGSMVGKVTSIGPDSFRFALAGGPADAKGLEFQRIR